jgi:hypothetical protein
MIAQSEPAQARSRTSSLRPTEISEGPVGRIPEAEADGEDEDRGAPAGMRDEKALTDN